MKNSRWPVVALSCLAMSITCLAQTGPKEMVVVSKGANALEIVDLRTLKVVGQVGAGAVPHEVAVSADGKIALVTNYGARQDGTTLSVIDLDANKEIHRVDLLNVVGPKGEKFGDLIGPHGVEFFEGKFYFTAEGSKKIGRYDPATDKVDWVQVIGQERTHMLVILKKTHTIYTSNVNSDSVTAVEPSRDGGHWTNTVIPVGKGPEGIAVSPDGKEVWVANSGDGTVSIIDTGAKKVVETIDVGTKRSNRGKFTVDGRLVLISDMGTGELVVVDAKTRKVARKVKLGKSVEGILVAPDGKKAFVAVSGEGKVDVVDLGTWEVVGTISGIDDADGMAFVK
jgi:YVTN family beta-propeller protein